MKKALLVFGLEPWLLPPAIEFIKVLTFDYKYDVDIVYFPSTGIGYYDLNKICKSVHLIRRGKATTQFYFPYWLTRHFRRNQYHLVISTDIIALQSLYLATIRNVINIGFWSFELTYFNSPSFFSFDFLRQKFFHLFINKMQFILIPSLDRKGLLIKDLNFKGPVYVILNAKRYEEPTYLKSKESIQMIYSGRLSVNNYLGEIIEALRFIKKEVVLHIAGIGDKEGVEIINNALIDSTLKTRIHYHGYLSLDELELLQERCHFGFVFYNSSSNLSSRFPAPTKVGDYISKGLVIIGSSQDYLKNWLEHKGLGITLTKISAKSISNAINNELSRYSVKRHDYQLNVFKTEYNMNLQVLSLLESLNDSK